MWILYFVLFMQITDLFASFNGKQGRRRISKFTKNIDVFFLIQWKYKDPNKYENKF